MVMFASKEPADLNVYPEINSCKDCWGIVPPAGVTMVPDDGALCECPRVQHNAPNPVLVEFRRDVHVANETLDWWAWSIGYAPAPTWTEDEITHARRVIMRLASKNEGAS